MAINPELFLKQPKHSEFLLLNDFEIKQIGAFQFPVRLSTTFRHAFRKLFFEISRI